MSKLIEKRKELEAKQKKLAKAFHEAGEELDLMKCTELEGKDGKERAASIQKMNRELEDVGKEVDELVALELASDQTKNRERVIKGWEKDVPKPAGKQGDTEPKTIGRMFAESDAFKQFKERGQKDLASSLDIDLKTLMTTSAGFAPETTRTGKQVEYATRPIQIIDLIPAGRTDQAAIVYMEETTFTNPAAEATEGSGAYAEATLAFTERSSTVRKIAVWLPVTQEQFEDVPGLESYVNQRLGFMVRQRLDSQILNGNGTPPNLAGILNTSGIQTFVRATEHFDAIAEALKRVRVIGRASPNVLLIHSNDWWSSDFRLKRTNEGLYILGNPSEPGPARLWGLPVVENDVIPEGTVLTGDFPTHCQLFERRGVEVDVTESHSDYFIYGKLAIRATMRVALPVYRPAAFCAVTSM